MVNLKPLEPFFGICTKFLYNTYVDSRPIITSNDYFSLHATKYGDHANNVGDQR